MDECESLLEQYYKMCLRKIDQELIRQTIELPERDRNIQNIRACIETFNQIREQ